MKILVVDMYGIDGASGFVILRKCSQCGNTRAIVNLLPYRIPLHKEERMTDVDAVLIREENSRSGMHYCRLGYPVSSYTTGTGESIVFLGKGRLIPAEWYKEEMGGYGKICEFTTDLPFKHEVVLERLEWPQVSDIEEETECPECWVKRLLASSMTQGSLYLAPVPKGQASRLRDPFQPGVRTLEQGESFFNHSFESSTALEQAILVRNNYGSAQLYENDWVKIYSPDHPEEEIFLKGPGVWEFYHPWPQDGRD